MNQPTFPLRLSPSMREGVDGHAKRDQVSINHFINLAIAEKLSRMEHQALKKKQLPVAKEA